MEINYYFPTKIVFGRGKLKEFSKNRLPGKRALVVISAGNAVKKNGYLQQLENELRKKEIEYKIYAGIGQNPDTVQVMTGAVEARSLHCDFIIGFGGGSCMDAAKAISVLAVNEGDIWEYMSRKSGHGRRTSEKPLPVVTIPTAAGSSSSVDPWTTIINAKTKEKAGYGYGEMFPVLAVIDPEIMCTVPKEYTIYQGYDIFCHCLECYLSKLSNVFSDIYAVKGIKLVVENFKRVIENGMDIEAREQMALADVFAGLAMCNCPVTSLHTLEHALSAFHPELPHGAGLIMLSEAWLEQMQKHEEFVSRIEELKVEFGGLDVIQLMCGIVKEYKEIKYKLAKGYSAEQYLNSAADDVEGLFFSDRVVLTKEECLFIFQKVMES